LQDFKADVCKATAAVRGVNTRGKESPFDIAFVHNTHFPRRYRFCT
jgi:hypothetical protein